VQSIGYKHSEFGLTLLSILGALGAGTSHAGYLSEHDIHHWGLGKPYSPWQLFE